MILCGKCKNSYGQEEKMPLDDHRRPDGELFLKTAEKIEYLTELRARVVPKGVFNVTPYFVEGASGAVILEM
jgi:hypothetical protein